MKREQETVNPGNKGHKTAEESPDLTPLVLTVLKEIAADVPPERGREAVVQAAAVGTRGCASLWRYDEDDPVLLASAGVEGTSPSGELMGAMKRAAGKLFSGAGAGVATNREGATRSERGEPVCTPVERVGERWGALVIVPGCTELEVLDFLQCLGKAVGLGAEKEALHEELARLRGRLAAGDGASDPMARYARLGQLAGNAYDDLAHILEAVEKSLRNSLRVPVKKELEDAHAELRKAKGILAEQQELAKLELPVLAMGNLSEIVEKSIGSIEDEVNTKRIRLLKRLDPTLPRLLLDSEKVKVAVEKVLATATARSGTEGWLRVEADTDHDEARVQVTWEERGEPGGAAHDMFVPFGSVEKGGVGLAVASQIIRQHGGGVCAKRFPSGTTALVITFPISSNQDRRRRKSRRSGLDRRQPSRRGERTEG